MWKKIVSTLRSYSMNERIVSVLLLILLFFSFFQLMHRSSATRDADTYYEGMVGYVSALNPLFVDLNQVDLEISRLIFSGLTKYDPKKQTIAEDMATIKIDDRQTTYTATLKDFLKWHDGRAVTADDVYFTFAKVIQSRDFQNPLLHSNFEGVEIEKVDEKTVKFVLNKPNSFFIANLKVGLLPRHIFQDVPVGEIQTSPLNQSPIGSGPFRVDESYRVGLDEEGEIRLERFDDYYGGRPLLKYFVFRTYPTLDALEKNLDQLDGVIRLTGDEVTTFQDKKNYSLLPYTLFQYNAIFFQMDRPLLKQKAVRLALQKTIYKDQLLSNLPNRMAVDTPLLELNQKDWVYIPDTAQAQGALFDGGWKLEEVSGKKIRKNKKGETLKLVFLAPEFPNNTRKNKETSDLTQFLKKAWEDIGFQIEVLTLPLSEYTDRVEQRDYDLLLAGQNLGYNLDTYFFWHSTQTSETSEGGLNLSQYKSFAADALIEEVRRTLDEEKKKKALQKLAKVMGEDIPALFLFRDVYFYVSDNTIPQLSLESMAFPADRFANVVDWQKK